MSHFCWCRSEKQTALGFERAQRLAITIAVCASGATHAMVPRESDLADLSLEQLGNVEVTSVSKHPERLGDSAASVYVISNDDIRRAGVTSLPDALRLAPNLQVAETNGNAYSISARGFNGSAANKLLVLIDGRSVYSPLFSGVFWDVQAVMLEDIDRIEVISGPGGTLWGTNAVNGVINIITRKAEDTQGGLVASTGGNSQSDAALRYGGRAGDDGQFRVYGMYADHRHTALQNGSPVDDGSYQGQVGFRADWLRGVDQLSVNGNAYHGGEGQPAPGSISISGESITLGDISLAGANFTSDWEHTLDSGGKLNVQGYFDHTERVNPPTFTENLDFVDLQAMHSLSMGQHAVAWGGEYRTDWDRITNSPYFAFLPPKVKQTWSSLFAQDEVSLREYLRLTVGGRIERNSYTGDEFLPNVRLAWKLSAHDLLWSAASRAVRSPSRIDAGSYAPGQPPFLLDGGPNMRSETAKVYEVGYRREAANTLSYSVTVFHADYDHLVSAELAPSERQVVFANGLAGSTSGVETWGSYQALSTWRLMAGFSALKEHLWLKPGSLDLNHYEELQGQNPPTAWQLRSSWDLPGNCESDLAVRHVAALVDPDVPAYSAIDLRLGWRPIPKLEVSMLGQNLFNGGHGEFHSIATRTELQRSVSIKLTARF